MPDRITRKILVRIFLVGAAALLAGCGYSHVGDDSTAGYQWRSLYRDDVRTVAIPAFQNKDFRRGVELSLSKELVQQLEARTPYKVVARDHADTLLEGSIRSIHVNTVSSDTRTALPQEQLYVVTVDFLWKDLRTGRILVDRKNFEQTTTYYPTLGEGEFYGSQQAVERLALGIVQELQADW